jgi:hypothetical protein
MRTYTYLRKPSTVQAHMNHGKRKKLKTKKLEYICERLPTYVYIHMYTCIPTYTYVCTYPAFEKASSNAITSIL